MSYQAKAKKIGDELRAAISKTVSEVMLLAQDNVANSTPVDTGHASSNWVLSTGTPYTGVDGSRAAVSFSAAAAGREKIRNLDIGRTPKVFLRNNVFYLPFLDKGSSQQAEAGFVTKAILAARRLAPYGRKGSVRKMLTGMARAAYKRGV